MSNDILVKVGADIGDFSRKMKESSDELKKFGETNQATFDAFKTSGKLITGAAVLLTAGLGKAVSTASNFESAMSQVKAISGATGDEFDSMREKAIEMGNATMFSASDAANSMANLAQMGWETDEILGGIEHTLNLAAAGGLELADAAMITANTMNQFGLEAEESERIADVFALTASSAGTDVTGLGDAMQYAGANASAAGMSIEETSAFIGVLGDAGITGSKAGTSLNAMLRDLKASAEDGAIAVGDQSVALYDAEGNMRDMPSVISEIITATESMSNEQRDATLANILGGQALVGFNAIAGKGADAVADLAGELYDSQGSAKDMADIMQDNLGGSLTKLSSAFEGVLIALGTALIPAIRLAVEWLTKLADWFNNLPGPVKTTIAVFLGLVAALLAIVGPALLFIGFVPQMIAGVAALGVVFGKLTGLLATSTTAMYAKAAASKFLSSALRFMTSPVGLVVGGVALLTAGVIGIVKWFKRESAEAKRLSAETEKLAEETDELSDAVEDNASAYEDKQSSTEAEIRNNEELARKVQELADKESLSATEKEMLRTYTDELNESMDGLNLTYDEESGLLNQSSEQIQARIDLLGEQDKANDAMERAKEITEQQVEAEKKLGEVADLRKEWNDNLEDGSVKTKEHTKAVEELDEQEEALKVTLSELDGQYVATEEQVESSMAAIAEATKNATDSQMLDYDTLEDHQKALVDEMQENWQDLAKASTDIFEKISTDAEVSFAEMQEIFDHNVKATADWADNLEALADAGVSSAFLDTFRERGPQSAAEVQALVDANIDEVKELGEGFEKQTEKALDQMAQVYNLDTTQFEAVRHLVEETGMTFGEAVEAAGFEEHGEAVVKGVIGGIDSEEGALTNSMTEMSDAMSKAFKTSNKIQSPSRVYKALGEEIPAGLKLGIDGKDSIPVNAIKAMTTKMKSQMSGLSSSFQTIGSQSIAGLSRGLDASKGSLFAKASGIAGSIAATMRGALKIKSPSRVMMDIGRWIPEGLADGIAGNARAVTEAVRALSGDVTAQDLSLSYDTPAGFKSSLAGAVSGTVDVNSNDSRLAGAIDGLRRDMANMRVEMDGREVGRITEPYVTDSQNRKGNRSRKGGGRR